MNLGQSLINLPLREAMEIYWEKIMIPLIWKNERIKVTLADCKNQIDDWEWTWKKDHACHCRSRGGSKTFDFVNYTIFRVIRTKERWAWIAAKGGQLTQASIYFEQNPLVSGKVVKTVANSRKEYMKLVDNSMILIGIVSTSNLGLRLDGIVLDEEEDMENKQSEEVYPQMEGMMTTSQTGQFLHLGTLWINTRFNENVEVYPTKLRPWDQISWLMNSPKMLKIMNNKNIPEWEKDLLYRCIATSPHGVLFPNLILIESPNDMPKPERYGFDFGGEDVSVGINRPSRLEIWICEEQAYDLERFPNAANHLLGKPVEAESGGYNSNDKYGNKCAILAQNVQAMPVPCTNQWKANRQKEAREATIYICRELTPRTFKDLKNSVFGPDGLYKKNTTTHQCHWLDAFLHAIGAGRGALDVISAKSNINRSFRYSSIIKSNNRNSLY